MCDGCGVVRYPRKIDYRDLCHLCAHRTDEFRKRNSEAHIGLTHSDETRAKMSKNLTGLKHSGMTDERKQRISAQQQGIPYEEWDGFVRNGSYCEKFDEACRERIRKKYECRCFICDKPQDENITRSGKCIKLSVHHIDSNKDQGCDGVLWKLIPLCMHCHPGAHFDPLKSRIEYLLNTEDM